MEYRTNYYGLTGQTQALLNYEVALYESGTPAFQFIIRFDHTGDDSK